MTRIIMLLAGGLAIALAAYACRAAEAEEEPPHLIADYFVRYLAAERQLKATVGFYEGDSLAGAQPRAMAGDVVFQGTPMEKRPLPGVGIRYTLTRTADYADRFRFSYRTDAGAFREHIIGMPPIGSFSFPAPLSQRSGATLVTDGGPLAADETLLLLCTDAANKAYTITLPGPTTSGAFLLPASQLAALPAGEIQVYLVRKKNIVTATPRQTTITAIEYYTATLTATVEP